MKRLILAIVASLFLTIGVDAEISSSSDEAIVVTTDDALELALANNLDIQAGLAALETARMQIESADNQWTPRLTATYSYTRLAYVPTIILPPGILDVEEIAMGTYDNYFLGLSFVWPIYTGGEREASNRIAKLAVEGLEAQQQILEDITGVLAQNYCLNLMEARGQIVAKKKSLDYINGLFASSKAFYEQGLIPKNDLLRIQVEQSNRKQDLAVAVNNERLAEDELNAYIGFDFGTPLKVEILGYEPFFFDADIEPFYELALRQRPEMAAIDLQYQVIEEQRRMSKSGRLPDVNLVVSFNRQGDTPFLAASGFSDPNTISGTINVTYDLYDGGEISDYLAELDMLERELDIAKKQMEQSIYLELERAYLSIKQAYGEISLTQEAIVSAEENLRITRRRFEEGMAVTNDVIEAEALLLAAQLGYQHSRFNYYRAAAYVGKAVGVADMNYYLELKDTLGLDDGNEE